MKRYNTDFRYKLYLYDIVDKQVNEITQIFDDEKNSNQKYENYKCFDDDTGNFHLIPAEKGLQDECSDHIDQKLKKLLNFIKDNRKSMFRNGNFTVGIQHPNERSVYNFTHIFDYLYIRVDDITYQITGIRFSKNGNLIQCCLNNLQFIKVTKAKNIKSYNYYPSTLHNLDRTLQLENNLIEYYNPEINFYDSIENIAYSFLHFIKKNQELIEKKLFIFKTNSLSNDKYLLKLNRSASCLELYSKVPNSKLNEYYSIRPDFDSSEYTMFEKIESMPCLFGGEKSPTPYGVFQVEKVSDSEYISGYRPGYDAVKFFGYIVIFEDYFIHSDMYEESVEDYRNASSISTNDTFTSGCIRISQKSLDKLLSLIPVGTTVIL